MMMTCMSLHVVVITQRLQTMRMLLFVHSLCAVDMMSAAVDASNTTSGISNRAWKVRLSVCHGDSESAQPDSSATCSQL